MTPSLQTLIEVARGDRPADRVLSGGRIVDVFTRQVIEGDIALVGDTIAGIGRYAGEDRVDLGGRFVAPGFIDAHVHIESALVCPPAFARAVAPCGTTQVVADPHEIANVMGLQGIEYMLDAAAGQPIRIGYALPSCVPASEMETAGARLEARDLLPLLGRENVLALGEVMNFPGVVGADPAVLKKIEQTRAVGKRVDGHAPSLSGRRLQAYLAAGIGTDHECTTVEEAAEKLRFGMHVLVREGTGAKNLEDLLPLIDERTCRRMMWCSDDRHPRDLIDEGHIDGIVRKAIALGLDPLTAIQMATLNPAEFYGLEGSGAIAPGRRADLVVFSDLSRPQMEAVYCRGKIVAEEGRLCPGLTAPGPAAPPQVMSVDSSAIDFKIPAAGERIRVIALIAGQILTGSETARARIVDGRAEADPKRDLLKLAVVERYTGQGNTGLGFVRGFGLRAGAMASSVSHDSHNLIGVGTNDEDMKAAISAVVQMGGGMAVAAGGRVRESLGLPVAGLMSEQPLPEIRRRLDAVTRAAHDLGATPADPFMILSFLALPVIPALKLTDRGLIDVEAFRPVPLFV
ncbi:MAG: adenine deaminase [Desulfobacterales bacterium]